MSKIKILAIPPDRHGVGKYRITDPFIYIQENYSEEFHIDVIYDVPNELSFFDNYDIIILHTFISNKISHEENVELIKTLKTKGKIVIVDIDDYWLVDQRHPMYHQTKIQNIAAKKIELLKNANFVTTTTTIFKDEIKNKLNLSKNVFIFPNAVNENEIQFKPKPTDPNGLIRFGWLGGSSHLHDIELLKDGIDITYDNYKDKVQFILCGFDTRGVVNMIDKETGQVKQRNIKPEETTWFQYEKIFTKNYTILKEDYMNYLLKFNKDPYNDKNEPYRRIWTQEINQYALNYNNFEVSLAPLYESQFNSCKSQLKVIEAGFHKKALISSEVVPYTLDLINAVDEGNFNKNGNALLVNPKRNHKQWAQHMKKLITNPNMVEDLGNRLYETVKDKYSMKNVSKDRVDFLKSII